MRAQHDCEAVVLAGGLGTRMHEISHDTVSKLMLDVAGVPVIGRVLAMLARDGFAKVTLCVGHLREGVMDYCGDGSRWSLRLRYSIEEIPLGTGGAVMRALNETRSPSILILNGDTLLGPGLGDMVRMHWSGGAVPVLGLVPVADRSRYGSVAVDKQGCVTAFSEKGKAGPGLVYAGCCVLPMKSLSAWRGTAGSLSLERDVIPAIIQHGAVRAHILQGQFVDAGTPEDFRQAGVMLGHNARKVCVFLDRDGVLNRKAPEGMYISHPGKLRMLPGAAAAVARLNAAGVRVILVTNQRGIGRGSMTEEDYRAVQAELRRRLRRNGAHLDAEYHCPDEDVLSLCRKPQTGMLLQAVRDFPDISLSCSWVVGDSVSDVQAGRNAGCTTVLIGNGAEADYNVTGLGLAVDIILGAIMGTRA